MSVPSSNAFAFRQNVSPLVTGIGRACYFRHSSQAATQEAFNQAVVTGTVEVLH